MGGDGHPQGERLGKADVLGGQDHHPPGRDQGVLACF
jgi:hypothetical protein